MMKMSGKKIKESVQKWYSDIARSACECCTPPTADSVTIDRFRSEGLRRAGYSLDELQGLPANVLNASRGCGNPTLLTDLREGETVVDLGCGAGIDVFLAAKKVKSTGRVIGIDMTEEIIRLANENAEKIGATNVEFKLGDIENLPMQDSSVDVIISNCVINCSSANKDKAFQEAFRVLKPGGRMVISDIVTQGELPREISERLESSAGCLAGSLKEDEYIEKIRQAGFKSVEVISKRNSCIVLKKEGTTFTEVPHNCYSIEIKAIKPWSNT